MAAVPRTTQAKQLLIRYIREHALKPGDRLPSQDTFRRSLKFGAATIASAIGELKDEGILEVRDKVGVYVLDPDTDGHISYTVGLATRYSEHNIFYSSLITNLHHKLSASGCMVRLFALPSGKQDSRLYLDIDDFPGLRRHVENNSLDAIIHVDDFTYESMDILRAHRIPAIFMGSIGQTIAPNGVFFDQEETVCRICRRLQAFHPRRLAVLGHPAVLENCRSGIERTLPGITRYFSCCDTPDGVEFARKLIAMPPSERPDWIIFQDDIVALSACAHLTQHLTQEEIPRSVFMGTLRHQLRYPLRGALYYDCNLDEYVESALGLMRKALRNNDLDPGRIYFNYRESTDDQGSVEP